MQMHIRCRMIKTALDLLKNKNCIKLKRQKFHLIHTRFGLSEFMDHNPLLQRSGLPQFDKIEAAHVVPAVKDLLFEAEAMVEEKMKHLQPTFQSLIEDFDVLGEHFEQTWQPIGHLLSVKNSQELREVHQEVMPHVVAFGLKVRQNEDHYKMLLALKTSPEWAKLDEGQQRIIDSKILSARLSGVGLSGEAKHRFQEISQKLSQLTTDFSNHVMDATKDFSLLILDPNNTVGWPQSLKTLAAQSYNGQRPPDSPEATPDAGPWRITLEIPLFQPFMLHSPNREQREELHRALMIRASRPPHDNSPLLDEILQLRLEEAKLLGFKSYAEMSLSEKMAGTVEAVEKMFADLHPIAWKAGVTDFETIKEFAKQKGVEHSLMHWDIGYWAERYKEETFQFKEEELRVYFNHEKVLDGLFALLNRLFAITVQPGPASVSTWHPDVRYYEVLNEQQHVIAGFFYDPYSRPENKRGGAWMGDCLTRRHRTEGLQIPVAYLCCNATPPIGKKPSLMSFREVETLFHEFGHGLQHMLTKVDYPEVAGISGVEWDAVELPSQFMENWCYHWDTLQTMTSHAETGAPLPRDLFDKLVLAKNYRAGSMLLRQLIFGSIDMTLHSSFDPFGKETIRDVQKRIIDKHSVLPMLPDDHFLCSFTHVFAGGYAAGYYSYKWAEILSADAFGLFEEAGLDDDAAVRKVGKKFRDTILACGGARHPMDVFRDFRGREPDPKVLLRSCGLLE